jgi:hypothetical protein
VPSLVQNPKSASRKATRGATKNRANNFSKLSKWA